MKNVLNFIENIASGQEITTKERGHSFSDVVFLLSGASYLQGVLHSSSLPDYIEDKKSGGQQTDCLIKNGYALSNSHHRTCRDVKADAKNRKIVLANRYS